MSSSDYSASKGMTRWIAGSVIVVAVLAVGLYFLSRQEIRGVVDSLTVHCAAGIKLPVEEAAKLYGEEYGVRIDLKYDNSGGLLSSIIVRPHGDLYIPADDLFIERGREKDVIEEAIPLAKFRLVIAVKPGNPRGISSLDDLLEDDVQFAVCSESAGAGKKAQVFLEKAGRWEAIRAAAKTIIPTVTNAASSVESSSALDAALIWDSTAKQHGLGIVSVPEFAEAVADIHVGVVSTTKSAAAALRFARYLAAPSKGGAIFERHRYEAIPGDAWAEAPELTVFCGGVNRNAIKSTLSEFADREGCVITSQYGGCGTLINEIETLSIKPELFVTCDASYMDMVQDLFLDPTDVSETRIVLLVRAGSTIRTLEDLAKEGVKVGITEPRASALGALSVALLKEVGIWSRVEPNVRVRSATAHQLILQMEASEGLDVALVYEANCQHLTGGLEFFPVDHSEARAVQNMAIGKGTEYPQLVGRLMDTLMSVTSKGRFTSNGFSWRGKAGS